MSESRPPVSSTPRNNPFRTALFTIWMIALAGGVVALFISSTADFPTGGVSVAVVLFALGVAALLVQLAAEMVLWQLANIRATVVAPETVEALDR